MGYAKLAKLSDGGPKPGLGMVNQIGANFEAGVPGAMSAAGDLLAAISADAAQIVPVGAEGAYMMTDLSQATKMAWKRPGAASVTSNDTDGQTAATGTWVKLNTVLNTEIFDLGAGWSGSTFTAPHGGNYMATVAGFIQLATTLGDAKVQEGDDVYVAIYKNGSLYQVIGGGQEEIGSSYTGTHRWTYLGLGLAPLAVGDTLEFYLYHTFNDTVTVNTAAVWTHAAVFPIL